MPLNGPSTKKYLSRDVWKNSKKGKRMMKGGNFARMMRGMKGMLPGIR